MNSEELAGCNSKKVIVLISGSAGELDWILPILDWLLIRNVSVKVVFLTRHAWDSVKENRLLFDFVSNNGVNTDVVLSGSHFFEKLERLSYLSYRAYCKLGIANLKPANILFRLFDKVVEACYMRRLPADVARGNGQQHLIFSEFPSLRRRRDFWFRTRFAGSIFFYHPHSPHIYAEDLDSKPSEFPKVDFGKKHFLLLGHPTDYEVINDGKELSAPDLEKIYTGHPKYSDGWLSEFQLASRQYRSAPMSGRKIRILVLSRGSGSVMDDARHEYLVESMVRVIQRQFSEHEILVKKHPRETQSHWDQFVDANSIKTVNDHMLRFAAGVDFVVSFWGSGAMDCFSLGVPVIEYYDPNENPKQQVPEGKGYTTIYRKLGIVIPANNEEELEEAVLKLAHTGFNTSCNTIHPHYAEMLELSNKWDDAIEKILSTHGYL